MSSYSSTSRPGMPSAAANLLVYRCVCGESFGVVPRDSGTCPHCGRHYTARAMAPELTETFTGSSGAVDSLGSPPADDLIGRQFGHFRIVGLLGQGGMGRVYQALDESLQRHVALKVIHLNNVGGPEQYERLVREARAQARVNHPHVVHIYYVGLNELSPFFAMELVSGRSLAEQLRHGPLPFDRVVRYALQIVSALERAAQFDIVHGDIKPGNILEVDNQTVKISDFGLSRRLSQGEVDNSALAGTLSYLAPEVARGGTVGIQSDMYSLGVTLFELTFGRLPYAFSGATLQERLETHVTQPPAFPDPWPTSLPGPWRVVLSRLLAKRPEDRYADYAELASDLYRLLPAELVPAAQLPRLMAWLLDLMIFGFLQMVVLLPALALAALSDPSQMVGLKWAASLGGVGLATLVLLSGVYIQCSWGRTPGKSLFQLRIVDRHGLLPPKSVLGTRFLIQFLPLTGVFSPLLTVLGLEWFDILLDLLMILAVLFNGALVLLGRPSLQDRILATRVVVDAQRNA